MLQSFAFYRNIDSTFSSQRRRRVLLDAGTVVIEQIVIEIATGKLCRLEVRETAAVMVSIGYSFASIPARSDGTDGSR